MGTKLAFATAALAALLIAASSASAAQNFTTPIQLSNPPTGGEPSIATDPQGDVLVAGPQGIPSGLGGTPGTGIWISRNDGTSFSTGKYIGSNIGGGDNDVVYDHGTFYTADLEAVASEVCKSTDRGNTWTAVGPVPDPFGCTQVNTGQVGPSDDRPWLAADPTDSNRLYLVYHEFVSAQPIAFRTDNGGGDDFANPCGPLITDPAIEANVPTDITGGTLVARPVVGRDGTLYVLFVTTTQQENLQAAAHGAPSGTFSQMYLAVSHDHCRTFTDHTVFDGQARYGSNDVQFGDVFNDLALDGAGNLYAIGIGYIGHTQFATTANAFVFKSSNGGTTWSAPTELSTPGAAVILPAAVGGPKSGQLAIGYFRTINGVTNPNDTSGKWTYSTAETTNGSSFTYRDVRPGYVYHNGDICNAGVLCATGGDRSLADFTSAALDAHGCPLFVFAGNPSGSAGNNTPTNTSNYVTRQLVGCFATTASTTTTKKHHRRHHKKKHHHKKSAIKPARARRLPSFTG